MMRRCRTPARISTRRSAQSASHASRGSRLPGRYGDRPAGTAPRRGRRCRPRTAPTGPSAARRPAPAAGQPRPRPLRVGVAAQRVRPEPGQHGVPLVRREHLAGRRARAGPAQACELVIRSRSAPRGRGRLAGAARASCRTGRGGRAAAASPSKRVEQVLAVRVDAARRPARSSSAAPSANRPCGLVSATGRPDEQRAVVPGEPVDGVALRHGAVSHGCMRRSSRSRQARAAPRCASYVRQHRDPPGVPLVAAERRPRGTPRRAPAPSPRRASARRR